MKKMKMLFAVLLMGVAVVSCSDDDDDNNDDLTCTEAAQNTLEAAEAYSTATDANFTARCNAYRDALEAQIDVCGDGTGALQAMIDNLGDCTQSGVSGSITVTAGSSPRNFNSNIEVTTTGNMRHVYAEEASTGYYIEFDIENGETGDVIQNFNIHLISSDYNPLPDDEGGNWTSNITTNSATEINGTFFGYVTSPTTGADIDLTSGVINIDLD